METDADQNNKSDGDFVESVTIDPGSYKYQLMTFCPANFNFFDANPPLSQSTATSDEESTLHHRNRQNDSRVARFRRRRLDTCPGQAIYLKYHSLANERKIRFASSTCNIELLCEMLDRGTSPNCYDEHRRSPLHLAACRGYGDIIQMLLQHGANPNIVDSLGNTPLHLSVISASSKKYNNVVRILLNNGASVHVTDRTGKSLQNI